MIVRVFAVLASTALMAGCVEKWDKPGATEAEFLQTKADCQGKAHSQYPPMMRQVQLTAGYTTPVTFNCYGYGYSQTCSQSGGQYVPPQMTTVDDNEFPRVFAVRECLRANGWSPVKDDAPAASPPPPR